jgi:predicted aspartyl protease
VISGSVNADREPVVDIRVHDFNGAARDLAAIVDTGFTGWLTLPPDLIAELGLPWKELGEAILADGSQVLFDVYEAAV